jgi:hypothetical protein
MATGRDRMKLRLQLLVESDTGEIVTSEEVAQLERHSLRSEEVGLTLAEAKEMLGSVQRAMVQEQLEEYMAEQSRCSDCGRTLTRKGQHEIVFRTLFGELRLPSPRFYSCSCRKAGRTESVRTGGTASQKLTNSAGHSFENVVFTGNFAQESLRIPVHLPSKLFWSPES